MGEFVVSALFVLVAASAGPAADKSVPLCPVCGQPALKSVASAYRGGHVYFHSPACRDAFGAREGEYATGANRQLVVTGQAKQVACPVTGEALQPGRVLQVGGVRVGFCCAGCLGQVADEQQEEIRLYHVFGNNAFRRGFRIGGGEDKNDKNYP